MSQVLGTPLDRAQTVTRRDRRGRPISLEHRLPERTKSVLYTGPPGLGKSLELDRAQELAKQPGWIGVRVKASAAEPLEYRFVRALTSDVGTLRKRHGRRTIRKLDKTLQRLTNNIRNVTHGAEIRYGIAPVQLIVKRQWDATPQDNLGATLNELADQLGDIAAQKGGKVLLMVDDVDVASNRDLWALTELSEHLRNQGREVYLVGAGSEHATSRLMAASGGRSHLPTTEVNRFDIREVDYLSNDELRPVLTERFRQARVGYQEQAVESLLSAANGNPSRLRDLTRTALQLAERSDGPITTAIAGEAAVRIDLEQANRYQDQWNLCSDEAMDLLDKVAAQGSRGLSMPHETQAAGPDHWVGVDNARQELVARGLLRDDGQRVTVANPGMRDWVRNRIGRATEMTEPAVVQTAQQAPGWTGQAAQDNEPPVFGTRQNPAHRVLRTDKFGRQISLDKRPPKGNTVLFTGQPGAGTSRELDQTQALADRCGWTTLRINASPSEPLENRFVRAATADLGKYRKQHGKLAAFLLKKKLGQVVDRTRNALLGFEVRVGFHPFQYVAKRQWDEAPKDNVGKNLNDLADHLGKAARKQGKPMVLMVDNLDVASERDLEALVGLAAHLEENHLPVFLVGAGGPMTTTHLLDASRGKSGAESTILDRLDHREVRAMTEDELHSTLTEPLRAAGIGWQPEAVDSLVRSANGSPSRMRDLGETAVQLAGPGGGITADVARAATYQLNDQFRPLYQAQWNNCEAAEKDLLARVGSRGPQGMMMRAELKEAASGRWQELDRARQVLIARGMLRENGDQVTVADPGMHEWIQTRLGQSVAHLGVALPTTPTQAVTQSAAAAEPGRQPTIREYRGLKFTLNS